MGCSESTVCVVYCVTDRGWLDEINRAVCLDLTSTKGAREPPRAQNSKNGEIAKNAFAMSGSRTRDLPSKNKKEEKRKYKMMTDGRTDGQGKKLWTLLTSLKSGINKITNHCRTRKDSCHGLGFC